MAAQTLVEVCGRPLVQIYRTAENAGTYETAVTLLFENDAVSVHGLCSTPSKSAAGEILEHCRQIFKRPFKVRYERRNGGRSRFKSFQIQ